MHAGIGLLSIATVIADIAVTNLLSKRKFYYSHKYEIIDDNQGEEVWFVYAR